MAGNADMSSPLDPRVTPVLAHLRAVAVDHPDRPDLPPSAELEAWRERTGRDRRIGDVPIGEPLPADCVENYRAVFPERIGGEMRAGALRAAVDRQWSRR
jgi:hypothetical protein